MTDIAITNQVTQVISFFVSLNAKFPKRFYVVNVKTLSKFILGDTATLTGKVIALSGQSPLLAPVWAVVRRIAANPVWVIFAAHCLADVYAKAFRGAKVMFGFIDLEKVAAKAYAANLALKLDSILDNAEIDFSGYSRSALTGAMLLGQALVMPKDFAAVGADGINLLAFVFSICPKAFQGAESAGLAGLINEIRLSALLAHQLDSGIFHRVIIA